MIAYWWIIPVCLLYGAQGMLSKSVNDQGLGRNAVIMWALGVLSLWPVVAAYSRRLVFDALLFDLLMVLSMYGAMLWSGAGERFGWVQWSGVGLALAGVMLVKAG